MEWTKIENGEFVDIKETLFSGQVFNFIQTGTNEYTGIINNLLISFKQVDKIIEYRLLRCDYDLFENILRQLKRLNIVSDRNTKEVYEEFLNRTLNTEANQYLISILNSITAKTIYLFLGLDLNYKKFISSELLKKHNGLRLVNNAIYPTIFSFICSQNNNIKRITKMVQILYSKGDFACNYKDKDFYFFPNLDRLCDIEEELKNHKFGYRSSYITKTAKKLMEMKDSEWKRLNNLVFELELDQDEDENITNVLAKDLKINFIEKPLIPDRELTRNMLLSLSGIGPKVADCILLIGFGFLDVVPIDTHIFKYALKTFDLNTKNLNKTTYKLIQDEFILRYGEYAGIVQLFIFKSYL
jgi:N-glycosylase/DNA lyase